MSKPSGTHHLLRKEGSDISDASTTPGTTNVPYQRPGYHRMASQGSIEFATEDPLTVSTLDDDPEHYAQGLGISGRPMSINRVPVGSRASISPMSPSKPTFSPSISPFKAQFTPNISSNASPVAPGSSKPLLSPRFQRHESGTFTYDGGGLGVMQEEDDISTRKAADVNEHEVRDDGERISMQNDNDRMHLVNGCASTHDIHNSRRSWLSMSILMLSIYSTVWSGIWLMLAIVQPRYGRVIHSGGKLTPTTASTLFALFAKTIELSFVTVFVTFLGQVLTRRSIAKASRGVTIAELNMRTWVIQPGFMITHWQNLRHAVLSVLGLITLTAAFVAMFYTTASDSIVAPHLKYGNSEHRVLFGLVQASYANPQYIAESCQTPITKEMDPQFYGTTCLAIDHAGQAYHNSLAFLSTWKSISYGGVGTSSNLIDRPRPLGTLYDNTTITGSWVETETSNMTAAYEKYKRIINNVTMSMPHPGVRTAALDGRNGILQPEDLAGVGEYSVRASVVSPTINVLCVNMNKTEISPLIYVEWPNATTVNDTTNIDQKLAGPKYEDDISLEFRKRPFLNSTVVDDIFEFGARYGIAGRMPPVFPMLPLNFNSLINITVAQSDSNYLLIKSADTPDYTMCQLRSWLSPNCSTHFNVSGTQGGHLESHCEQANDKMAYNRSVDNAPLSPMQADYRNVGSQWLLALALNTGITNANASSGRLLSQLVPSFKDWETIQLKPLQPSIAETLAVMAGSTLLLSAMDSSYYHFWNYTANILNPGTYQSFNATLASQQYASGLTANWQGIFYIVLALVFACNVFCLVYFFLRSGLVTDYSEPQNLFALAINSPPSRRLSGSCGAGPKAEQLNVDWHVVQDGNSSHFFIKEGENEAEMEMRQRRKTQTLNSMGSYSKLSNKRRSWL